MANLQPMFSYSFLQLGTDESVSYGSLSDFFNSTTSFTIGAWIRLLSAPTTPQQIFAVSGSTLLGVQTTDAGILVYASLSGLNTDPILCADPLAVNQWFYVAMVYDCSNPAIGPTVNLLVNGMVSGGAAVPTPNLNAGICSTSSIGVDISVLAVWPVALTPSQCSDIYATPTFPSVGIYSFVNGIAADVSGNGGQISPAANSSLFWGTNCLDFEGVGMAILPSAAGMNPGSAGAPFSICGWININLGFSSTGTIYCNGASTSPDLLISSYGNGSVTCNISVQYAGSSLDSTLAIPMGEWHWFGVTYANQTLQLYLDGQPDAQVSTALPTATFSGPQAFGAIDDGSATGSAPFAGQLQAIAFFNAALAQSDLAPYMTSDPSESPACVAYYSFESTEAIEDISGLPLTMSGGATILETFTSVQNVSATAVLRANSGSKGNAAAETGSSADAAARPFNLRSLGASVTTDLSIRPKSPTLSDADIDGLIAGFENTLATCPVALQPRYRQLFRENLYRGIVLQNTYADPRIGLFSYARSGSDYVFYHHLPEGKQEVYRLSVGDVDEYVAWRISIIACILGIVFSALGLSYLGNTTFSAVTNMMKNARVAVALKTVLSESFDASKSGFYFIMVLQSLFSLGQIPELARQVLSKTSWWSFAFAVASLILNIIAMLASGGAYLAMMIAQMGIGIAQFILLLNDKPSDDSSSMDGVVPVSATKPEEVAAAVLQTSPVPS